MAKTTASGPSSHSVLVDHDLLMQAQEKGGHPTYVGTVHQGLRLLAGVPAAATARAAFAAAAPAALKQFSDMTEAEKTRSYEALVASERGVNAAIMLLQAQASQLETDADAVEEDKRINLEIGDLERKRDRISKQIQAARDNELVMSPPDADTVANISRLADSVGEMTADANKSDQIIAVARQLVESVAA